MTTGTKRAVDTYVFTSELDNGRDFVRAEDYDRLAARVAEAVVIIEVADNRAMAADGPVGHVRDEMTDSEWRQLYVALTGTVR